MKRSWPPFGRPDDDFLLSLLLVITHAKCISHSLALEKKQKVTTGKNI